MNKSTHGIRQNIIFEPSSVTYLSTASLLIIAQSFVSVYINAHKVIDELETMFMNFMSYSPFLGMRQNVTRLSTSGKACDLIYVKHY
jgi:hypothetical protein